MKKIKLLSIALVIVFLMVSAVYAQTQGKGAQCTEVRKGRIVKDLNLTPEQEQKLEENRKARGKEMAKLHAAIKEKQAQLQKELRNPTVTKATIEPLANQIKSLQAQLIEHRINGIFAVKEILTPEQFAKFQQMTDKRQEKRKGRFQNWRERRKGANQNQGY